jgi:2-hydroxychromene-2-carboxylate isomerase
VYRPAHGRDLDTGQVRREAEALLTTSFLAAAQKDTQDEASTLHEDLNTIQRAWRHRAKTAFEGRRSQPPLFSRCVSDVRFYFDFSCPYAYVASTLVEQMAERTGAALEPRPMLLGGVFRAYETPQNLSETLSPGKARHNLADMHRQAAVAGVPLNMPAGHPIRTVQALRCVLAVGEPFMPLAHEFYRAYWVDGIDISTQAGLVEVLERAGHDPDAVLAKASEPAIKQQLRERTDEAIEAGVFGVPTFVVDDDLYWGVDRLDMVEDQVGGHLRHEIGSLQHPVDLYFDYSSPFSYVGCALADAHLGDHARWKPMLLGAVFKQVGMVNVPMFAMNEAKRRHAANDMERQARAAGLPFSFPSRFPMNTVLALRATILANACENAEGRKLVHRIYRAYWAEDQDIGDPQVVARLCDEIGLDGKALVAGASDQAIKDELRRLTGQAVEAGVFGAPTFVVHLPAGAETFWGADRLDLARRAAADDARTHWMTANPAG